MVVSHQEGTDLEGSWGSELKEWTSSTYTRKQRQSMEKDAGC